MDTDRITHYGTVVDLSGRSASVRLDLRADGADCGGCALANVCRPDSDKASQSQITIDADVAEDSPMPSVGERVKLISLPHSTAEATMTLLVVPLLIFLIIAVGCTIANVSQAVGGISALAGAALVYPIVYIVRRKRKKSNWLIVAHHDSTTV